jgi:pimeloyl-ACP methyl ester carboxylesterase
VLQAVIDTPDLYTGVCVITPNFRELHSAEIPFSKFTMPIIRSVQKTLREKGQPLFDALATPDTVKQILKEPYKRLDAVDDTLVQVLLDPLLLDGASKVVFDTLSYSAGPLPEQQLASFPSDKPVWICYGKDDPWTPAARVDALLQKPAVEKVVGWDGVGHCPHDEAPELVNPFILEFLETKTTAQSSNPLQALFGGFFNES